MLSARVYDRFPADVQKCLEPAETRTFPPSFDVAKLSFNIPKRRVGFLHPSTSDSLPPRFMRGVRAKRNEYPIILCVCVLHDDGSLRVVAARRFVMILLLVRTPSHKDSCLEWIFFLCVSSASEHYPRGALGRLCARAQRRDWQNKHARIKYSIAARNLFAPSFESLLCVCVSVPLCATYHSKV